MNKSIFESFEISQNPFSQIITEVNNLKKTFNGNPKEEVERMMRNGQLSQAQFNEYAQVANQISQFIK